MDWLILIFLLPLIVAPIVLLCGFSGCGLDVVGTAVPSAPSNLVATAGGTDSINLNWKDNSTSASDFIIERTAPGGIFAPIPGIGLIKGINFVDQPLPPGTTFLYQVKATWGGSYPTSPSNVASATTDSVPLPPPPPPPPVLAVPIVHTYTSGSGSETIVTAASKLVVEVWGAGGSGRFALNLGKGGGGGAYSKKTLLGPFAAGSISWSVGARGGAQTTAGNNGKPGGSSRAGGPGQLVNIANVGGGAGGTATVGAGGTAGTGGDTNVAGGTATTVAGGTAAGPGGGAGGAKAVPGKPPGGGGGPGVSPGDASSGAGANGQVKFNWT
jgi:hypothetical protein